jgi:hypothetical protein
MSKVDDWVKLRPKDFECKGNALIATVNEDGSLTLDWNTGFRDLTKDETIHLAKWLIENYGD